MDVLVEKGEINVFVNDEDEGRPQSVGIVLRNASIVEYETDELAAGLAMTPFQARCLASALNECAERIEAA